MSTLSQFVAPTVTTQTVNVSNSSVTSYSNVHSVQTGFVSSTATSGAAGLDCRYTDVTISAVPDTSKVLFFLYGYFGTSTTAAWAWSQALSGTHVRLLNATTMRISLPSTNTSIGTVYLRVRWNILAFS